MDKLDNHVNFYFVLGEANSVLYKGHRYWYATDTILPGTYLDWNSIPWTVPRMLLLSDYIIACANNQEPIYLKNRKAHHTTPVDPEELMFIKLASLPILG